MSSQVFRVDLQFGLKGGAWIGPGCQAMATEDGRSMGSLNSGRAALLRHSSTTYPFSSPGIQYKLQAKVHTKEHD